MGLILDQARPGGSGNSNDDNTARRFFYNSSISSAITDIDLDLIERFSVILQTLLLPPPSGFEIDTNAFNSYATETARKFVEIYPWYYMPASVHKVLLHGTEIISKALLPIGQLSEEA